MLTQIAKISNTLSLASIDITTSDGINVDVVQFERLKTSIVDQLEDIIREWVLFGSVIFTAPSTSQRTSDMVVEEEITDSKEENPAFNVPPVVVVDRTRDDVETYFNTKTKEYTAFVDGRKLSRRSTFVFQDDVPNERGEIRSLATSILNLFDELEVVQNTYFNMLVDSMQTIVANFVQPTARDVDDIESEVSRGLGSQSAPSSHRPLDTSLLDDRNLADFRQRLIVEQAPHLTRAPPQTDAAMTKVVTMTPTDPRGRVSHILRGRLSQDDYKKFNTERSRIIGSILRTPDVTITEETSSLARWNNTIAMQMAYYSQRRNQQHIKYWETVVSKIIRQWIVFSMNVSKTSDRVVTSDHVLISVSVPDVTFDPLNETVQDTNFDAKKSNIEAASSQKRKTLDQPGDEPARKKQRSD